MKLSKLLIFCVLTLISTSCVAQVQVEDPKPEVAPASGDDSQLEINKIALLTGTTEQMRMLAANIMLKSEDPRAREAVLDALKSPQNGDARAAVCKALSKFRGKSDSGISNKAQFIKPLLAVINEGEQQATSLAAEALLIYDYNMVGPLLETVVCNGALDVSSRLNAMNALKLRHDKRAPIVLLGLVDDTESKVANAARALLGSNWPSVPVGNSPTDRVRIVDELKRKSKDEFLRDWVLRQDQRLKAERAQVEMLKGLYREVLNKHYDEGDTAAREALLLEHLRSPQSFRKLWAIDKVYKWRNQANTELPDSLTPVLKSLISDSEKLVRLNAATMLFFIVKIDSADVLIKQLDKEVEADVRIKLFSALGEACRTALVDEGVPDQIKAKTLEWAAKFLAEASADQAVKGADVIGRLLEKNGLAEADIDIYLALLKSRFEREVPGSEVIKGKLLRTMASLCANPSGCKQQARPLYKPLFDMCLEDKSPLVREEAIQGLITIDSTQALKDLKTKLANDDSANVRTRVIILAKRVGTAEDLAWLLARLEAGTEVDVAWQAVLTILTRSEAKAVDLSYDLFAALKTKGKLSNSQWQEFLEVALSRADGNPALVTKLTRVFADFSIATGDLEQAKAHLTSLALLVKKDEKTKVQARLLGLELKTGRVKEASKILSGELKDRDLGESDAFVKVVNRFLADLSEGQNPRAIVKSVLKTIKTTDGRPEWEKVRSLWLSIEATNSEAPADTNTPS